ncbi:MAG: metalloregulator ArsR/SmtB family transcription factor [Dysosmobacter welbionis]
MEEQIDYEERASLLKALSNPIRLQIVHGLLISGCHNVGCMEASTGMSQSCISQHLQKLRAANVVTAERSGNEVYYQVASREVASWWPTCWERRRTPMSYDVLVIGGGPRAVRVHQRPGTGRSALVVSNPLEENPSGGRRRWTTTWACPACPARRCWPPCAATRTGGVEFLAGKVLNAVQMPDAWYVSVGPDMYNARAVVLAAAWPAGRSLPARRSFWAGASATAPPATGCSTGQAGGGGGIHRHRPAGGGVSPENRLLRDLFRPPQAVRDPGRRPGGVRHLRRPDHSGGGRVHPAAHHGPHGAVPGLAVEQGYVTVDRRMATNLPGLFAAGDCTGGPLQVSKAAEMG